MLVAVIMAGGSGTRFWPLSTEQRPKQFLTLFGSRSLLQLSYDRISALLPPEQILVLTNARFQSLVKEQLPELPAENIIGEPLKRDTAAAITLAALVCRRRFPDSTMAVLTADHVIEPVELFRSALLFAEHAAEETPEALYTFGVAPTFPSTGYGYLRRGARLSVQEQNELWVLKAFKEKPALETAQQYLSSGAYLWNSGMFIWRTETILEELRRHLPRHIQLLEPLVEQEGRPGWERTLTEGFAQLEPISIDFGVMERADHLRCVSAPFSWSDVGGWLALEEYLDHDAQGNGYRGRVEAHDARHNLVFCEDDSQTVALVGVSDLIVVRSGDRTLVVPRDRAEEIKALVQKLGTDPQ